MTTEEDLKKALDKLAPVFVEAYKITLVVIALYKFLDTRGAVDRNGDGTGDTTK